MASPSPEPPDSRSFEADESFEDPGAVRRGDARSVVGHLDDGVSLAPAAGEGDSGVCVAGGVVDEIADESGQLLRVSGRPSRVDVAETMIEGR